MNFVKLFDNLKKKISQGQESLRAWIYMYLYQGVSLPETFEFAIDLARARKRYITMVFIYVTAAIYFIENSLIKLFKKG